MSLAHFGDKPKIYTHKFSLADNPSDIKKHYEEKGFAIFRDQKIQEIGKDFRHQFAVLTEDVYRELGLGTSVDPETVFDKELMEIHSKHRERFSHLWNASQALPGLYGAMNSSEIHRILKLVGMNYFTTAWTPNVRIDCPFEDKFILPDHQDRHFNGGSENSCTVYFQLNGINPEMGRLNLRPGSHRLGSCPYKQTDIRPYFYLDPGPWENFENFELAIEPNDLVIFHMDLVHKSAPNRGKSPRVTFQLRFNNFMDSAYKSSGWEPLFLAQTTEKNLGLNHSEKTQNRQM